MLPHPSSNEKTYLQAFSLPTDTQNLRRTIKYNLACNPSLLVNLYIGLQSIKNYHVSVTKPKKLFMTLFSYKLALTCPYKISHKLHYL